MDIVGLDLHKRECQLARKAPDGTITDRRIATSAAHLSAVFGEQPRARILLEASTESEWVARHLEALGHEVIVADPNFRADVRHPHPTHQDRQTRCAGADGGVRHRRLSARPSAG